jgi:hypothetical protein
LACAASAWCADPPPCPPTSAYGCYTQQCRTVNRTILNARVTETKCVAEVPVKKGYTVKTKDVPTEIPYTRMMPVRVKDPRTGQTRTEMGPETVMQKATTTYIVVLPPEGPDTTRKEERKKLMVEVKIGHAPAQVVEKVPVSCKKK